MVRSMMAISDWTKRYTRKLSRNCPWAVGNYKMLRLLTILLGAFFHVIQASAQAPQTKGSTTAKAFEEQIRKELKTGQSRDAAENILRSWSVNYQFVPRDQFARNNLTTTITTPPGDTIGALIATTKAVEKNGIFETFVAIVVFIDGSGNVSGVASKTLTAGP